MVENKSGVTRASSSMLPHSRRELGELGPVQEAVIDLDNHMLLRFLSRFCLDGAWFLEDFSRLVPDGCPLYLLVGLLLSA
eukprot:4147065-Amphidinium_carterae.1